jgi:hypothetical protein
MNHRAEGCNQKRDDKARDSLAETQWNISSYNTVPKLNLDLLCVHEGLKENGCATKKIGFEKAPLLKSQNHNRRCGGQPCSPTEPAAIGR